MDGTRLNCDDFMQNYTLTVIIINSEKLEEGAEFEVLGNPDELKKAQEEQEKKAEAELATSNNDAGAGASTTVMDEEDLVCLDDDEPRKRKADDEVPQPSKKLKTDLSGDDIIVL